MNLRFVFPVIALAVIAACNNSGKKTETDEKNEPEHTMPAPGTNIPELPAIPEGAKVMFSNLKQGDVVSSPFKVQMGVEVIRIDTAGPVVAGSGHHHIIIDGPDSLAAGEIIPKDSTHLHFGKGQTEAELTLAPGKHRITLQMADGLHRSYGGRLSAAITVTVKK